MENKRHLGSVMRGTSAVLLGLTLSVTACYPGDAPSNVQDYDVVLTVHDDAVDFGDFTTYAMPDSVVHVVGDDDSNVIELPRDYDELILELVADNMADAGYLREMAPETNGADLILLVGAVGVERTSYWYSGGCYWSCWGWYPGWGYPGYPGYGPGWGWGYPPYIGSSKFEQGAVLLTLVDPNGDTDGDNKVPVVWAASGSGLLKGEGSAGPRITNAINQMFSQSPYLGR